MTRFAAEMSSPALPYGLAMNLQHLSCHETQWSRECVANRMQMESVL